MKNHSWTCISRMSHAQKVIAK